jgi:hypothetical protein
VVRNWCAFFLGACILCMAFMSCGGGQNVAPPTGAATVGTAIVTPGSPVPSGTDWPCMIQVYTSSSGTTPSSTAGLCGSGQSVSPSGSIACQVTLPTGGVAVGWCVPGMVSSASASPVMLPSLAPVVVAPASPAMLPSSAPVASVSPGLGINPIFFPFSPSTLF